MTCECFQAATASWCRVSGGRHSCPQKGIKANVLHAERSRLGASWQAASALLKCPWATERALVLSWPRAFSIFGRGGRLAKTNLAADAVRCVSRRGDGVATPYFSSVFVFFFLVFTPSRHFLIRDFLQHLWRLSLDAAAAAAISPDGFKFCSRDVLPDLNHRCWGKNRVKHLRSPPACNDQTV